MFPMKAMIFLGLGLKSMTHVAQIPTPTTGSALPVTDDTIWSIWHMASCHPHKI